MTISYVSLATQPEGASSSFADAFFWTLADG